jgi:hypothetical protein
VVIVQATTVKVANVAASRLVVIAQRLIAKAAANARAVTAHLVAVIVSIAVPTTVLRTLVLPVLVQTTATVLAMIVVHVLAVTVRHQLVQVATVVVPNAPASKIVTNAQRVMVLVALRVMTIPSVITK